MENRRIAGLLGEIADLLDIKGENPFRIRSYRTAAEAVAASAEGLAQRLDDLTKIPGIGSGIAGKIREIVKTGDCGYRQELLQDVPHGLLELLRVPGLGPKGVQVVWTKLGVGSAAELEAAIDDGRFLALPGMGEKKASRIRKGLEERRQSQGRHLRPVVARAARTLATYLRENGAQQVETAGSFRRGRETVGDLDLLALGGDPERLAEAFTTFADVREVLARGANKSSIVLHSGLQVDLRHVEVNNLGAALQYFTGSKAHNVALRERAVRRGLKLNEYGLFRVDTDERIAGQTEDEIYAALGLAYCPPELREAQGEIEAAEAGPLPRLVEAGDLRGDLHSHTTESDGRHSLPEMVEAARRRGLSYLAITDHSRAIPSATNGTGMDEARCLAHIARIRELQPRYDDIRLLAGIEVDILPDGRLDMADEVLAQLDVVVGSLHSRLTMERDAMTARVLKAFENPRLHIWGHPLARLIGKRDPVALDIDAVLDAAVGHGVALELNGQPDRLDLPDHLARRAAHRGAHFVIDSDSHHVENFEHLDWATSLARRAGLGPDRILNTRPAEAFLAALRH